METEMGHKRAERQVVGVGIKFPLPVVGIHR